MAYALAQFADFSTSCVPAEILSTCFLAAITLVERRGRGEPLDPRRQIELKTLLDSIPDMVLILGPNGVIVDANCAASEIAGLPHQRLVGLEMSDFARHMNGEMAANVVQFRKQPGLRALAGEEVREERQRVRHPGTGEEIELLISANPIRNESGQVVGALLIARDISELTQLQKRLADIERHQAIGHVAAGIAHDFNNTLQTISQAVAVIQMSPDRPASEQRVFLEMIQNAVRRGAEVIARIRDYLRSGKGGVSEVDVRAVMEEAEALTQPLLRSSSVAVIKNLKPIALVSGNRADLLRMFTNLIINSVQAMPKGGKIVLGCEERGNTVCAWVRDTGLGISPEARQRIFHPYFTTKAGGTGLGLSGAQKIMLDIGGDISFSSEQDQGTQFDLTFPKVEVTEEKKTA